MREWKDVTSYSRADKDRKPRSWELRVAGIRICVHRLHPIPDQWFVDSPFHEDSPIDARLPEEAKEEAVRRVREICEAIAHGLS